MIFKDVVSIANAEFLFIFHEAEGIWRSMLRERSHRELEEVIRIRPHLNVSLKK